MRTTKEEREYLRAKYSRAKDYDDDVRRDAMSLLDDADALTTIALAAGLGADATAEEVAERVGEMRGALVMLGRANRGDRSASRLPARDLAARLAEDAGRG